MNQTWSLEDLYRTIASQWRLIVIVIVIAIMGAVGANFLVPERYEAEAVLTVEPIAAVQTDGSGSSINMETERVVATSTEVLSMAAEELDGTSLTSLQDAVEVTVPRDSQVLAFTFGASDADFAAAGANAVANSYNEQRVANAQRVVSEATANLTDRIDQLLVQLDALPADSLNRRNLELQLNVLQERLASLSSATFSSGSLVSPAVAPRSSTKPSIAVFIAAGLFLGVLLGTFIALVRGRVRSSRDYQTNSAVDEPVREDSAEVIGQDEFPPHPSQSVNEASDIPPNTAQEDTPQQVEAWSPMEKARKPRSSKSADTPAGAADRPARDVPNREGTSSGRSRAGH